MGGVGHAGVLVEANTRWTVLYNELLPSETATALSQE